MGNSNLARLGEGEEYAIGTPDPDRPTYDTSNKSQAKIVEWRMLQFSRMGFDLSLSLTLAKRRDVDQYEVKAMLDDDCSLRLAAEIVL